MASRPTVTRKSAERLWLLLREDPSLATATNPRLASVLELSSRTVRAAVTTAVDLGWVHRSWTDTTASTPAGRILTPVERGDVA